MLLYLSTRDLAPSFNGNFRDEHETVCPYLTCELAKSVVHPFSGFFFFLRELRLCYGDVLRHSEASWLSKRKVLDRFCGLPHEINRFRSESNTSYSEVRNFNWWLEIDVFTHIESMSNEFQIHFQGQILL